MEGRAVWLRRAGSVCQRGAGRVRARVCVGRVGVGYKGRVLELAVALILELLTDLWAMRPMVLSMALVLANGKFKFPVTGLFRIGDGQS